jgi:hypothetical protein
MLRHSNPEFTYCGTCTRTMIPAEGASHRPHGFNLKHSQVRLGFIEGGWSPVKASFVRRLTS